MTAATADQQDYDPSTYWAAPARNYRTSARLHLQHLLFQNTLGHYLAPEISDSVLGAAPLRVADLGCGNGAWLCDLATWLAARGGDAVSAQLDGYDINATNFPAAAFLPARVTLTQRDVLAAIPHQLRGVYDVVHVRAFASVIAHGDTAPLLTAARALLKPGGWLQWEESRADTYHVAAPSADTPTAACDRVVALLQASGRARGADFGFLGALDAHVAGAGFAEVSVRETPTRPPDYKAWTEDYLMVWEELGAFFPPRATAPPGAPMTREAWDELFARAVRETENEPTAVRGGRSNRSE